MNTTEMLPKEALALLDSVCAQVKATREEHVRIQAACKALRPVATGCTLVDVRNYLDKRLTELRGTEPRPVISEQITLLHEVRAEFFGSLKKKKEENS